MNLQTATADFKEQPAEQTAAGRVAGFLGRVIYLALLTLMVLMAVFYGGAEPWWKAFLASAIFALCVLWIVERLLSNSSRIAGLEIVLPILALAFFSFLQTVPFHQSDGANAISVDPFETKVFALQLLALALLAALFFRYVPTTRRLRALINVILGIAVASALFGILRQTTQHQDGFLLPLLQKDVGYGQFINKNHFAYLMEMGLGLALGLVVGGGVRRERALIYLAALLPIWTALVLANSRGGLLAMLVQLCVTLLLFTAMIPVHHSDLARGTIRRLARSAAVRLVLVAGLVVLVVVGVVWLGGDRLVTNIEATRGELSKTDGSRENVHRMEIWQATGQMIKANPFVGVGMGAYWAGIPTYHDASGTYTPQQAHNDYLELVASGGIVGLAIGVWFAIVVFKRARANLRSPERFRRGACFAALIGITGVAVHSLVDFGLHRMINAMVFTALIVIATCNAEGESDRLKSDV